MGRQNQQDHNKTSQTDFNGAAVIDDEGREIPITEKMIKEACEKLERQQLPGPRQPG